MAEEIVIKYSADVSALQSQLEQLKTELKQVQTQSDKTFDGANADINKQVGLIEQLDKEYSDLIAQQKKATNTSELKAINKQIEANRQKLQEFNNTGVKTSGIAKELKGVFLQMGTAVAGAFAVSSLINFGKSIVNTRAEFQKLEAVLTNTLGSEGLAKSALQDISNFASQTNFGVLEITDSFVKLANRGFTPTKDELRKLADVANSTGKSFDQLTEALLDAQTGEFERLKEFGIKTKQVGDKLEVVFKNKPYLIDKNSESIKNLILSFGNLDGVMGSTKAISETLGGQISNLSDNFDSLFNNLGKASEGIFSTALSGANKLLGELNNQLSTGIELRDVLNKSGKEFNFGFGEEAQVIGFAKAFNEELGKINDSQKKLSFIELNNNAITKEYKNLILDLANGNISLNEYAQEELKIQAKSLYLTNQKKLIIESENALKKKQNDEDKKRTEDNQKALEKAYNDELARNERLKKIKQDEAKLSGVNAVDIALIEEEYQKKRIEIIKRYGKLVDLTKQEENVKLLQDTKAINDERLKIEQESRQQSYDLQQEVNDKLLSNSNERIEQQTLDLKVKETQYYNTSIQALQDSYVKKEITSEEFNTKIEDLQSEHNENLKRIEFNAQQERLTQEKDSLNAKIKANEDYAKELEGKTDKESLKQLETLNKEKESLQLDYNKIVRTLEENSLSEKERLIAKEIEANKKKNDELVKGSTKTKKQLTDDQKALLNFAISSAKQIADAIADNRKQSLLNQVEEERRILNDSVDKQKQTIQTNYKYESLKRKEDLQERFENGKITEEQYKKEKDKESEYRLKSEVALQAELAQVEEDKRQKEAVLKEKEWRINQQAKLTEIAIDTAVNVAKSAPDALAMALSVATGAISAGIVKAQKPPKFKKGGEIKGYSHEQGGVIIEAEGGEYVVNKERYAKNKTIVEEVNKGNIEKYIRDTYVLPEVRAIEKRLQERKDVASKELINAINNYDTSHLERLTKSNKKVIIDNTNDIANAIGKQINTKQSYIR